jgi:hypothetical protein
VEKSLAGELIHPSTSSPRASLRQWRQEHLYSGTPGRTVWAQSRQTNRPSLCAIIGLNSMPTVQWGHLMVKVVSVSVGIGSPNRSIDTFFRSRGPDASYVRRARRTPTCRCFLPDERQQ